MLFDACGPVSDTDEMTRWYYLEISFGEGSSGCDQQTTDSASLVPGRFMQSRLTPETYDSDTRDSAFFQKRTRHRDQIEP